MDISKMKVFHGLVNYGTQSGFFARELNNRGIESMSVTGYDPFLRVTNVTLKNSGRNIFEKLYNILWNSLFKIKCFFKFNIFHFYYGNSLGIYQFDLPFYHIFGKKVIFHYLGFDVQLYQYSVDKYKMNNVRYAFNEKTGKEHDNRILKRLKFETKFADLQMVCAPCYSEFVPESFVLPLVIDLNEYLFEIKHNVDDEIIIMHAPTSRDNKGTSFIEAAIDLLSKEGYKIKKILIENLSHQELKNKYKECDIFVDQILAGWYGTASIEAMAIGRPTVCFLRESYFEHIDFGQSIPIINAEPDTIYEVLKKLIENREQLPIIGAASRKFVEDVHDLKKITDQLIEIYKGL